MVRNTDIKSERKVVKSVEQNIPDDALLLWRSDDKAFLHAMLDDHGERGRHTDQPLAAPERGREKERRGGYYLAEWHSLNTNAGQ